MHDLPAYRILMVEEGLKTVRIGTGRGTPREPRRSRVVALLPGNPTGGV